MMLATNGRNLDGARRLFDWLASPDAAGSAGLSAWQATTNGLQALQEAAPALDVDWATRQYRAARQRWAGAGFGPTLND
jgi:hypothetical protein